MITHCPICRYSLEGLPEKHRCPECGFEYEKDSMFFRAPGALWAVTGVINLAGAGLFSFGSWKKGDAFVGTLSFVFTATAAVNFYRFRESARSGVLLSNDQVREIRQGVVVKTVHFDQIDKAQWSRVDGRISLCLGENEVEFIRTAANAAIARAIQARLTKRKQIACPNVMPGAMGG